MLLEFDSAVNEVATKKEVYDYKIGDFVLLKAYQVDWALLGLSAMDELVNQMVQPRGATWQQGH